MYLGCVWNVHTSLLSKKHIPNLMLILSWYTHACPLALYPHHKTQGPAWGLYDILRVESSKSISFGTTCNSPSLVFLVLEQPWSCALHSTYEAEDIWGWYHTHCVTQTSVCPVLFLVQCLKLGPKRVLFFLRVKECMNMRLCISILWMPFYFKGCSLQCSIV